MNKYTIESKVGYPGPKEYQAGSKISGAVYVESLIPGTPLPYKLREIQTTPDVDKGFVLDASMDLREHTLVLTPQIDQKAFAALVALAVAKTPLVLT